MANVLSDEKRLAVLAALCDGNSERAIERMTGVNRETIGRLSLMFGEGAIHLHNRMSRGLSCSLVQVDEIWSFIGKKEKRVTETDGPDLGEAYTFVALDSSSRFVIGWYVGKRNQESTDAFTQDIRARLVVMPAMTSDGFAPYISAIGASFGPTVDYAQTVKNYTKRGRREGGSDHRYEPARDPFITKKVAHGAPDLKRASTSHIERANLTVRMHVRRFTRLCNGFSKKIENHRAAVSLHVAWYNFCRVHETLRVTPAMEAGITDHVWSVEELVTRALAAEPCTAPEPKKLAPPAPLPNEKPVTAKELPNGRGWLRVVQGGKSPQNEAPKKPTPPAKPVVESPVVAQEPAKTLPPATKPTTATNAVITIPVKLVPKRWEQMDLFGGKQCEKRMNWRGDEPEPEFEN
jgi:IS1 family transposase